MWDCLLIWISFNQWLSNLTPQYTFHLQVHTPAFQPNWRAGLLFKATLSSAAAAALLLPCLIQEEIDITIHATSFCSEFWAHNSFCSYFALLRYCYWYSLTGNVVLPNDVTVGLECLKRPIQWFFYFVFWAALGGLSITSPSEFQPLQPTADAEILFRKTGLGEKM